MPAPGEEPVIHVFPAWPKHWDARFLLAARGGFLVSASMRNGSIEYVEIESRAGVKCRLRNPFGGPVRLIRDGKPAGTVRGDLLHIATQTGEKVRILGV